ncbi:MAG TPA: hypothetical protein VJ809_00985, partial [Pirellulales bacterium]|nr:hypothetical protein [Pirellulales bacterium]
MNTFKDSQNNTWQIDLPFGTVLRVKAESEGKYNLLDPEHENLADRLAAHDFEALYELLWLILRPVAEERGIDAAKFGQLLAADCLLDARQVLWRVWTDFFQKLQRPDRATVLEKLAKYNAKALELVKAKISDKALANLDQRVEAKMAASLNRSFGDLGESLDSI